MTEAFKELTDQLGKKISLVGSWQVTHGTGQLSTKHYCPCTSSILVPTTIAITLEWQEHNMKLQSCLCLQESFLLLVGSSIGNELLLTCRFPLPALPLSWSPRTHTIPPYSTPILLCFFVADAMRALPSYALFLATDFGYRPNGHPWSLHCHALYQQSSMRRDTCKCPCHY